jgi:hypothetical protein
MTYDNCREHLTANKYIQIKRYNILLWSLFTFYVSSQVRKQSSLIIQSSVNLLFPNQMFTKKYMIYLYA